MRGLINIKIISRDDR